MHNFLTRMERTVGMSRNCSGLWFVICSFGSQINQNFHLSRYMISAPSTRFSISYSLHMINGYLGCSMKVGDIGYKCRTTSQPHIRNRFQVRLCPSHHVIRYDRSNSPANTGLLARRRLACTYAEGQSQITR